MDGIDHTSSLRKSDWLVQPCSHALAELFIKSHHYARGCSNTGTYCHALYRSEDLPLVGFVYGIALWIPPTKGAALTVNPDWQKVLCLSRLCCSPDVPKNGATFLLSQSRKAIDRKKWPHLLTYADTAMEHTGAIYLADGWERIGPVPAGDVWVDGRGRRMGRKRGGRTLTQSEMIALGFTKLDNNPKIKFVRRDGR